MNLERISTKRNLYCSCSSFVFQPNKVFISPDKAHKGVIYPLKTGICKRAGWDF